MPNAALLVLDRCGHFSFLERPHEVVTAITEFLTDPPSPDRRTPPRQVTVGPSVPRMTVIRPRTDSATRLASVASAGMTGVVEPARRTDPLDPRAPVRGRHHPRRAPHRAGPRRPRRSPQLEIDDPVRDPTWWTVAARARRHVADHVPAARARSSPSAPSSPARSLCEWRDVVGPSWLAVLVGVYSVGAHTEGRRAGARRRSRSAASSSSCCCSPCARRRGVDRRRRRRPRRADRRVRARRQPAAAPPQPRVARRPRRAGRARTRPAGARAGRRGAQPHRPRAARHRRPLGQRDGDPGLGGPAQPGHAARRRRRRMLENVERTGRQTMDELRQVLGVLRDESGGTPGDAVADARRPPGARRRAGGLPVRLAVTGVADQRAAPASPCPCTASSRRR